MLSVAHLLNIYSYSDYTPRLGITAEKKPEWKFNIVLFSPGTEFLWIRARSMNSLTLVQILDQRFKVKDSTGACSFQFWSFRKNNDRFLRNNVQTLIYSWVSMLKNFLFDLRKVWPHFDKKTSLWENAQLLLSMR